MARRPRVQVPGAPHHVYNRGNDRQAVVRDENDAAVFYRLLGEAAARADVGIHAYALLGNHFHLIATPRDDTGLTRMMHRLGQIYVQYFNARHERTGTLWEGRFGSSFIETEPYLLTCCAYVDLNPVRAGLAVRAWDYRWSSCRALVLGAADPVLTPHPIVTALERGDEARRWAYRRVLERGLERDELRWIRRNVRRSQPLASESAVVALERRLGRRIRPGKPGRPRRGST